MHHRAALSAIVFGAAVALPMAAPTRKQLPTNIRSGQSRSSCRSLPGGSIDILARVLGQKMTESWGQQVIAETRPRAATMIGMAAAAQAPADGYTLVVVVSNHTTNPALNDKMPYDALKDFEPISLIGRAPTEFNVNTKFPPQNLKARDGDLRQDQPNPVRPRPVSPA